MFDTSTTLGLLQANTTGGVFGTMTDGRWAQGEPVEVARRNEVKAGSATILTNISGEQVDEYQVQIVKVFPESESDCRDYLIKVTDQPGAAAPSCKTGKLWGR